MATMHDKLAFLVEALKIIKANGLNPALYLVLEDTGTHLIVKNWLTGTVFALDKR